jgi:hypothetical protein
MGMANKTYDKDETRQIMLALLNGIPTDLIALRHGLDRLGQAQYELYQYIKSHPESGLNLEEMQKRGVIYGDM